ncbi:carbonic anhydrase [Cardinium endosymbiont of Oedothorax gibbosus]|uniref:carbonic anhydrase n=1 Tax=Cardinium endosymbiont of Oedothorax gibbosus TaxID=931101 RepID=UPI002024F850|nr:carbonic anhydrase [Cardinium endosymbiont of Oedothorax gibbosus]CAH2560007.1 Carbonic anhydrase family protein [Cardinium endosymbiont of Oedothorax gibbosus]
MEHDFKKILQGYKEFRNKYVNADASIMYNLHRNGQQPKIMVIACCDARVDPALILQCDPGDLFVVRNVGFGGIEKLRCNNPKNSYRV